MRGLGFKICLMLKSKTKKQKLFRNMLNSVKIFNSSVEFIKKVNYHDLNLPDNLKDELMIGDKEFLYVQLVKTKKSLFDSYFTKIDVYLYKKDNILVNSFDELNLQSEHISKQEILCDLNLILEKYLKKEMKNTEKNILNFIYKHNLLTYGVKVFDFISDDGLITYLLGKQLKLSQKLNLNLVRKDENFLIFLKQLDLNTNLLTNIIKAEELKYFEQIYYFFVLAQLFEKENHKYSACVYYLKCYTSIKDGFNVAFKRYLLEKIKKLNKWNNVFIKIIDKVKKKEETELKILLESNNISTFKLLNVEVSKHFNNEIKFSSKEKILYFENDIVGFNNEFQKDAPIRYLTTMKCEFKSDLKCLLISFNGNEEVFVNVKIKKEVNQFFFNPRELSTIQKCKLKCKNEIFFLDIGNIILKKVNNSDLNQKIKAKKENDKLIVKFYSHLKNKPNITPLIDLFEVEHKKEFVKFILDSKNDSVVFLVELEDKTYLKYQVYKTKKGVYKVKS